MTPSDQATPTTERRGHSAPRQFWTSARVALVSAALALPAASLQLFVSACGNQQASGEGSGGSDGTGEPSATSGAGGIDADATVPDGQPDVKPPNFAALCGEGECAPGLPDSCGVSADQDQFATLGCQVVEDDDGEPVTACVNAGEGETDAPCQQASDCVPGDACTPTEGSGNKGSSGVCRPYCCGDVEACPAQSFCASRSLIGDSELEVPVCVPIAPCELLTEGACAAGTTCAVVRTDGSASCVTPGSGTLCEACPCAAGLVCAVHTGLCQKLCHTEGTDNECGAGFCQGGSDDYPAGIGVCVGSENSCDG